MQKLKESCKPDPTPVEKNLKSGYPDCGNGLYSEKWDYKTWFNFNQQK